MAPVIDNMVKWEHSEKKMQLTELYKLSLDICQEPLGPLESHKRNPRRDPICVNAYVSL